MKTKMQKKLAYKQEKQVKKRKDKQKKKSQFLNHQN